MNDDIFSVIYLILILVLILPGFIYAIKNKKESFKNFFIWILIIGVIIIVSKFLFF
tara:strand:- start:88 stop:255 length:168 start_codon:yes stop_codon:yes gene_type:complete